MGSQELLGLTRPITFRPTSTLGDIHTLTMPFPDRFFSANSPMEFDPVTMMFTCLHVACKVPKSAVHPSCRVP